MRAARLHAAGDLRVVQEQAPFETGAVGPGTSLVRVTAVGICGSDLHWWAESGIGDARLDRPLVLGHEAAGVVEDGPRRGERVAIDPAIPCETCRPCRDGYRNLCTRIRFAGHSDTDGALRDFMTWPSGRLHALPDKLSDTGGAVLEPLGVAIHALDLSHMRFGADAAVIGCGPIGLLLVQLLRAAGAGRVVAADPLAHRRKAAAELGADVTIDPSAADGWARLGDAVGEGAGAAFELAGNDDAVGLAIHAARPGGRVMLGGIPGDDSTRFPASVARRKGLTIAMVRRMNEVYPRAISLAMSGRIDLEAVVSDRFPLSRATQAFDVAARREGLKVVVEPGA
jgi:L-iditol 2-dehydrogenase